MGLEPCIDGSRVARGAMIFWLVVGCGYVFGHVFGVSFAYDVTYKTGGKCEFAAPAKVSCQRHESGHSRLGFATPMLH